jgi:UDP-glucose 4-epimerase
MGASDRGRYRRSRPRDEIANPQLGQSLLGWKPLKSDLYTIVKTAWEWHDRPSSPIAELPARKTRDQAAAIH